jgi:cytochrome P450
MSTNAPAKRAGTANAHPDTFDAQRHLHKREELDTHRFHFASVSDDMFNFGAGRHACPGRFFAQQTLKLNARAFTHARRVQACRGDGEDA